MEKEGPVGQTGQSALVPVEQAEVMIFGKAVRAVRLPDGRIAAVLTDLVEAIELDRAGQVRRLRDDEVLDEQLLFAEVETPQGRQPMDVLTAWAIPAWLQGVQVSRLAPKKRPAILAFKREAADVLYRHFAQRQPQLSSPSTLVPSEPMTEPEAPARDANRAAWRRYHEAMIAWLAWQEDVERWRTSMEHRQGVLETRMDSAEAVLQLVPELIERLGPATLSPEHQRTVQAGVNRLHELTRRPHAALYNDLREGFRVGTYKDIPEARWEEVVAWFRERIGRAGGGTDTPPEQGSLF